MPVILLEKECGPKCRSRRHVLEIISLIVRGSIREFQAYSKLCYGWFKYSDLFGRTALHLAASCGKTEILKWLLEENLGELNNKDLESGYTALHRAILYGQLACARLLVQFGADVQTRDVEGLSPLDIAMLDRPPQVLYTVAEPNEVYTWGENNNSTLGHPSPHKRTSPEPVDFFKKKNVSIKQVVLCKYHCVFLTQVGQVYTCGHGPGGRLGHGDQHTILVPRLLESVQELRCLEIAAATDHTVLRMEGGLVYSYGLNQFHQLGQTPVVDNSPLPRQMNLKSLKGKSISGVCAGRFHSVVWTPDSVFTVGLNAGQLGHQKGENFVSQLRQVSCLRHTDIGIAKVACSDAALICLTTKGDVFVLHEYQCRRIVTKGQGIDKVLITGGHLDHGIGLDLLTEKGGEELHVLMKNESGQLCLWRNSDPIQRKCHFSLKRQLTVTDVCMTTSCLILSTNRGEAFMGYLSNKRVSTSSSRDLDCKQNKEFVKEFGDGFGMTRLQDLLLKEAIEEVQVRRLQVVYRAVMVAADQKGKNFAVLQALPSSCMSEFPSVTTSEVNLHFSRLLHEADSQDNIHDAVIQVGERCWPVHRYVIAMRSDVLRNMVLARAELGQGEKLLLKVDSVSPDIMEQVIQFMYTDTCDYLQPGYRVKKAQSTKKDNSEQHESHSKSNKEINDTDQLLSTRGLSAYQVQEKRQSQKGRKKDTLKEQNETTNNIQHSQNPVRVLQEAAKKLGVKGLSKRLDAVKYSNEVVVSQGKNLAKPKVKFDRGKLPELYDVNIRTEDGHQIKCHKCVLVSRLQYFHSMLATGWMETFHTSTLTLPVWGDVLQILVDYLYTDEAPALTDCTNEELLCHLLVVSDQLLAWRLKEMCEVALASIIAFKNVSELLEFSVVYNADQLRVSCQQFICINLSVMIECRYLDGLSQETLDELTIYYRSITPSMAYRVLTPNTDTPTQSYLDALMAEFDHLDVENSSQHQIDLNNSRKSKQIRKRTKSHRQSISEAEEKTFDGMQAALPTRAYTSISPDRSAQSEDAILAQVENLNRQAEHDEKKLTAALEKVKQTKWKPLNLTNPGPVAVILTHPEDVPTWTPSYQTLVWPSNSQRVKSVTKVVPPSASLLPVPASPMPVSASPITQSTNPFTQSASPLPSSVLVTSRTSLRDIMQQESGSQSEKVSSAFIGRVSWRDVKKQQNKDMKNKQDKMETSEMTDKSSISTPSRAAWGPVSGPIKSFRELMMEDKDDVSVSASNSPLAAGTKMDTLGASNVSTSAAVGKLSSSGSARGLPLGRNVPLTDTKYTPSSPVTETENPWQRTSYSPPCQAAVAALDFSAILRDEKERSETLVRTTQKPLALIQLEERAMTQLLEYYTVGRESEHFVTVERVTKQMAAPVWHR